MIQDPSIQWCFNDQYGAEIIFNTKRGFYQVEIDLEKNVNNMKYTKKNAKKEIFAGNLTTMSS